MKNEQLRTAITRAGLTLEEFADIVQVDVKTVQRWLAGRTPYPRHRGRVAGALDTTEHALWPDAAPPPAASPWFEQPAPAVTDVVAGYGYATDRDAPNLLELVRSAGEWIDLIIRSVTPDLAGVLLAKAHEDCHVRAIIEDPDAQVEPLLGVEGIEIHSAPGPERDGLYRADQQMLLALHPFGTAVAPPPVIVVERRTSGGLFDRLADAFEDRWEQTTPLLTLARLHAHLSEADRDASPDLDITSDVRPDAPRRWPGRRP